MITILRHLWCCWCCKGPGFHSTGSCFSELFYHFCITDSAFSTWSVFTLTGCSADTALESWNLSQCQLPPAPAVSPLLCLGRCWAFSEGTMGCKILGDDAAWKQILSVVPVSAVELLSYGRSCFLTSFQRFWHGISCKVLTTALSAVEHLSIMLLPQTDEPGFSWKRVQLLLALQAATSFQAYTGWQRPDYIRGKRLPLK